METLSFNLATVGAFAGGFKAALTAAGYIKHCHDSLHSLQLRFR